MRYDIVIVSYNSKKWLPDCIEALHKAEYDLKELNVIVVDNASTDDTVDTIRSLQGQYQDFGGFQLIESKKNLGFGGGCNLGAFSGKAPLVFMLNVDTELEPDALKELDIVIESRADGAAFELRQKPVEVGRHNHPVTMECSWNSGAAVVYRREVYEAADGFDEHMFMYCEDVDLSWRIRGMGYKLIYVPRAGVYHYTRRNDAKKEFHEYHWTLYNKLMMHYKYGGFCSIFQGNIDYLKALRHPRHYDHVRKVLAKNYLRHFWHLWPFLFWRVKHRKLKKKIPATYIEGFEIMRSLYDYIPLKNTPLVSIIVRTCGRPAVLRETLRALRHQTYRNFEILVQEDGAPTAQKMIEEEFSDLPIRYEASVEHIGRSRSGNRALARAKGKFFNFLDDDDYFYPEHIELMLSTFEKYQDADIVVSGYMVYKVDVKSVEPYEYEVKKLEYHHPERIDIFQMCKKCQIPILSAMFRRELYDKAGGLREDVDTNEDWAMWLKFFKLKPKHYINARATCGFFFPADQADSDEKIASYRSNYHKVIEDETLRFEVTGKELNEFYNLFLADVNHMTHIKHLEGFLHDNLQF